MDFEIADIHMEYGEFPGRKVDENRRRKIYPWQFTYSVILEYTHDKVELEIILEKAKQQILEMINE